jgi:hypothetical protein
MADANAGVAIYTYTIKTTRKEVLSPQEQTSYYQLFQ